MRIGKKTLLKGIVFSLLALSLTIFSPKADGETLELGDKIKFGNYTWNVIHITNNEWFLVMRDYYKYGTWSYNGDHQDYQHYFGTDMDNDFTALANSSNFTQAEKNLMVDWEITEQYVYNARPSRGRTDRRKIFALSAEEFCQYCAGTGMCYHDRKETTDGLCGTWEEYNTLTREGNRKKKDSGDTTRPAFYDANGGNGSGFTCKLGNDNTTYTLQSQKIHNGASVSYFSIAEGTNNSNRQFSIAGSTPANTYDLIIKGTRTITPGSFKEWANGSGCFSINGGYPTNFYWQPALKIKANLVTGLKYDEVNDIWSITGSTMPTAADATDEATLPYSTDVRQQPFVKVNKTRNINYTLEITKSPNPISIPATQSGSVLVSNNGAQTKAFTGATGAAGAVTYSLVAKNSSNQTVSYITVPNASSASFSISPQTPAGTYTITISATAAGNTNYNRKTVTSTYTLTVKRLDFADQTLQFNYASSAQSSTPETFTAATGGSGGTISYSIVSQKLDGVAGNYFTLNAGRKLKTSGSSTPAGTYTVVIRAADAGKSPFNAANADATFTLNVIRREQTVTFDDQSIVARYNSSRPTRLLNGATAQYNDSTITYSIKSQKTSAGTAVNHFSMTSDSPNLTIAQTTPVGEYKVVVTARAENDNYLGVKDATITVKIEKALIGTIEPSVDDNGIVSWAALEGASGYKISIDGTTWTNATSPFNYKNVITAAEGRRTIQVYAVGDANHEDSKPGKCIIDVYKVKANKDEGAISVTLDGTTGQTVTKYYIKDTKSNASADTGEKTFLKWDVRSLKMATQIVTDKTAPYHEGDELEAHITVTNNGNKDIENITITSEETGEEFTIDLLPVGESRTSVTNFTIEKNQEDFDLLIEATGTSDGTPVKAWTIDPIDISIENVSNARYAVSIMGIGEDIDKYGERTGLTFGPAFGGNYLNSYHSHTPSGTTSRGHEHRCIHNDEWETIIYWNNVDPLVYEQCIAEGCTKSVPLTLSSLLLNANFAMNYTGDGPSGLFRELTAPQEYTREKTTYNGFRSSNGGWGASRIRAELNGADSLTLVKTAPFTCYNDTTCHIGNQEFTTENAMIAAFPKEIADEIAYKEVRYDSVSTAINDANLKITYDKLWLLSPAEMTTQSTFVYGVGNHYRESNLISTDHLYSKFLPSPIKETGAVNDLYSIYVADTVNGTQSGAKSQTWYRSISSAGGHALAIHEEGKIHVEVADHGDDAVSPCFTLQTTYRYR